MKKGDRDIKSIKKLAIPLDPLPKRELCPYEKIRENNIQERKEAMRKCGFFEDLEKIKKKRY